MAVLGLHFCICFLLSCAFGVTYKKSLLNPGAQIFIPIVFF